MRQLQDRFVWKIFLCRRKQRHQEKMGRRFPPLGYCGKFNDLCEAWESDSQVHTSCFQPSWFVLWAFVFLSSYHYYVYYCVLIFICLMLALPWLRLPPPQGARQLAHAFFCLLSKVWAFITAKHLLLLACLLWVSGMSLVFPQQAHLSSASSLAAPILIPVILQLAHISFPSDSHLSVPVLS